MEKKTLFQLQLYPNYYDVILEPIDLKMIAKKVLDNEYRTPDDMDRDVTLLVNNAKTFNEPKSPIYKVRIVNDILAKVCQLLN
ncbi:hypothetical protein DPMN_118650 [Dreissena polymorpha]|uniref:Bromo domain-containing protein n=1 Tax=Dreissena polymorpha TaxID=45954 RepID=A0A9D4GKI0_DREPO|nr:hypothetical protein DPMN_118650 [Dreissena polymorpha]